MPSVSKIVGGVAGVVTLAGGIAALAFTLDPGARPCLGGSKASISASIFPGERRRDYLVRAGMPLERANEMADGIGAVVRYTISADGYKGKKLAVAYTLFSVGADDTLGPVVGNDRIPDKTFRPSSCSDEGGYDAFVRVPRGKARYRILLELFRDERLTQRVSLFESDPFRD
jgi:hypothetical protein